MNELNFNYNQCVKEISNIGSSTFQNICNGELTVVPWGTSTWADTLLGVCVLVIALYFLIKVAREIFEL